MKSDEKTQAPTITVSEPQAYFLVSGEISYSRRDAPGAAPGFFEKKVGITYSTPNQGVRGADLEAINKHLQVAFAVRYYPNAEEGQVQITGVEILTICPLGVMTQEEYRLGMPEPAGA